MQQLDDTICKCLPSLHVLTGCDTTNALFKIGKKTAFDILLKNSGTFKDLEELPNVSTTEAIKIATKFVLALYKNKHSSITSLNELRYKLTVTTNKPAPEHPPTDDAFQQHGLR